MDAELEKLIESGKLTARGAEQLEKLKPGTYCLHKSWGFGRVAEWNLLLNQILIDFPGKKAHGMQLTYAAENLTDKRYFVGTVPTLLGPPRLLTVGARVRIHGR